MSRSKAFRRHHRRLPPPSEKMLHVGANDPTVGRSVSVASPLTANGGRLKPICGLISVQSAAALLQSDRARRKCPERAGYARRSRPERWRANDGKRRRRRRRGDGAAGRRGRRAAPERRRGGVRVVGQQQGGVAAVASRLRQREGREKQRTTPSPVAARRHRSLTSRR